VPDHGDGLAGLDAEGDVTEHPIFVFRIGAAVISEPDVAELDFAADGAERAPLGGLRDRQRLVEELEDASQQAVCRILNFSLRS
jgi:hypothetical protein